MKKLTRLLLLASLCCATSCDIDVPTEEVTDVLTWDTRCMMSGGIPLAGNQAEQLRSMLNNPDKKKELYGILADFKNSDVTDLDVTDLINDLIKNNGAFYGTQNMIALYKYAYSAIPAQPKNENDWYCACGTELCDNSVGCFGVNNSLSCTALKVENDTSCDPVVVDNRYFGYLLATHLLPILRQTTLLRQLAADVSNDSDAQEKYSTLIGSPNLEGNLLKSSWSKNPTNTQNVNIAKLFYASICECMNGSSKDANSKSICPADMLLHVNGAHSSATPNVAKGFYQMVRRIAVHLLKNANKLSKYKAFTDDQLAMMDENGIEGIEEISEEEAKIIVEMVDQFLVDQVTMMLSSSIDLKSLLDRNELKTLQESLFDNSENANAVGRVKLDPTCQEQDRMNCNVALKATDISKTTAKAILEALKDMLVASYSKSSDASIYEAHRRFFGQFVVASMTEMEKSNLFALTFTQNATCKDHTSMAGHALGIKQYCHSPVFASGVFTFEVLASSVLVAGQAGNDNACALADGIIMDDTFVLKKLDLNGKVTDENLIDLDKSQVLAVFDAIGTDRAKQLFQSIDLNNYGNQNLTAQEKTQVRSVLSTLNDTKVSAMLANAKVSINSIQINLSDSTSSNPMVVNSIMEFPPELEEIPLSIPIPLSGGWLTYRCPMGASCTLDNECGVCANSPVEYNYSSEYTNAICEYGKLVNKTSTSSEQQSPQNGN